MSLVQALYPLGFIASLLFGFRVLMQWWEAEKEKKSVVSKRFWILSIFANFTLLTHSFIQMQFPMYMVQSCHAILSYRNLNLMQPHERRWSINRVLLTLLCSASFFCLLFFLRCYLTGEWSFMRIPKGPWEIDTLETTSLAWNVTGILGITLFASRFWVQWIGAEQKKHSYFGRTFWWVSVTGALLSLLYFIHIDDWVNMVSPGLGLIPYIRNLYFVHQKRARHV